MPNSLAYTVSTHSQLQFLFLKAGGDFSIALKEDIKGRFWSFYFLFSVKIRNAASLNSDMIKLKKINLNKLKHF